MDGDGERVIFENVNITFRQGMFYSILGDSGCGKTTFLSAVGGLDGQYKGRILYQDRDIRDIGLNSYRKKCVSFVFQSYNLIPYLNAVDNIIVALSVSGEKTADRKQIGQMLQMLGIDRSKASRRISTLSGGEQQRVAVARAVIVDNPILLADEPTGNLNSENAQIIIDAFAKLAHEHNKCIIMVTHNVKLAMQSDCILQINPQKKDFEVLEYEEP